MRKLLDSGDHFSDIVERRCSKSKQFGPQGRVGNRPTGPGVPICPMKSGKDTFGINIADNGVIPSFSQI